MKKIWIAGAGGFAAEVYSWLLQSFENGLEGKFIGFADDFCHESRILERLGLSSGECETQKIDNLCLDDDTYAICAVGHPANKREVVSRLREKGVKFMTLIHPSVTRGSNCRISEGCVICPKTVITSNVFLENFVTVNVSCCIGHDVQIGSYSVLAPHAILLGNSKIGNDVLVGANVVIHIGKTVGDNSTIGLGSVLVNDAKPGHTYFGNPAQKL